MRRLATIDKALASELAQLPEPAARLVAIRVARFAVARTGVRHEVVVQALGEADTPKPQRIRLSHLLEGLVAALDDRYFDLQDAGEQGLASQEVVLEAFSKARAVQSLAFALNESATVAALEAAYEAHAATDDLAALKAEIRVALGSLA